MKSMACNFRAVFSLTDARNAQQGGSPLHGDGAGDTDVAYLPFALDEWREPHSFGRPVPRSQAWTCDVARVAEVGVMAIKPGVVGDFKLQIDEIGVYRGK